MLGPREKRKEVCAVTELRRLSVNDGRDVYEMLQAIPGEENGLVNSANGLSFEEFRGWLAKKQRDSEQQGLVDGWKVPSTVFWLYADGVPVGFGTVRHFLTDALRRQGGNIGYGIAPGFRGKGYGRELLRLLLKEARALGIDRALVTIHTDNLASQGVALSNGGVIAEKTEDRVLIWVPTDADAAPAAGSGAGSRFSGFYFVNGTAYAGKSTLVRSLAEKYGGVACGENYHDALLPELDPSEFPCLTYTRDLEDWHEFIRRSPEEYERWFDGVSLECERLELRILEGLRGRQKPVFVDTNISPDTLKRIAPRRNVLILLADPEISVRRFFERPDRDKQFLYRLILEEPDPEKAMENYRQGLKRINSRERYDRFLRSGFTVLFRDEARSAGQTLALAERAFGLV